MVYNNKIYYNENEVIYALKIKDGDFIRGEQNART